MSEENILKCKFHEGEWNKYKVVSIKVSELWASCPKAVHHRGKPFYQKILEDIKAYGLHFPLIVVDAKRTDLVKQKQRYGGKIRNLPFDAMNCDMNAKQFTVWGGSNRWFVADEIGYEYVDCIIVPNADFDKARSMQCLHRQPYNGKLY